MTLKLPPHWPRRNALKHLRLACSLLCCASILCGSLARSASSTVPKYQGAHWSLEAHGGFATPLTSSSPFTGGPTFGLSLRLASVLSLADVQLEISGSMQRKKDEDSGDEAVERGGVGLSARLHPFFLLTLNDSSWETFLAGLFLEVGANLEFTSIEAASVESDLGWRLGFGTDFPLTSFDKGWSLWLGISFRAKFVDLRTPSGGLTSVDEGVVLMSIGYRNHDINFTRWPRPSEFKETPEDIGE